jgi:hypothetical protein
MMPIVLFFTVFSLQSLWFTDKRRASYQRFRAKSNRIPGARMLKRFSLLGMSMVRQPAGIKSDRFFSL